MSLMATSAPSSATLSAIPLPIPRLAPVIRATFPFSLTVVRLLGSNPTCVVWSVRALSFRPRHCEHVVSRGLWLSGSPRHRLGVDIVEHPTGAGAERDVLPARDLVHRRDALGICLDLPLP